jgi:hypothetical protein
MIHPPLRHTLLRCKFSDLSIFPVRWDVHELSRISMLFVLHGIIVCLKQTQTGCCDLAKKL